MIEHGSDCQWLLVLVSSEEINPGDLILDYRGHLHVALLEEGKNYLETKLN